MNRRARLPGADELFRATGGAPARQSTAGEQSAASDELPDRAAAGGTPRRAHVASATLAAVGTPAAAAAEVAGTEFEVDAHAWEAPRGVPARSLRIGRHDAESRPTGRERHDEKITVYCSPDELVQLEQARLILRAGHGLAVDRGRIVREAVAVVLADLQAKGDASILVRRLRGR